MCHKSPVSGSGDGVLFLEYLGGTFSLHSLQIMYQIYQGLSVSNSDLKPLDITMSAPKGIFTILL